MTKLPPGFILEVPQHLSRPDVPLDPLTAVPFVDLENYCCGGSMFVCAGFPFAEFICKSQELMVSLRSS